MRSLFLTTFILFLTLLSPAQNNLFVPEEIATNRKLYPSGLSNLQWQGNSEYFTWQDARSLIRGSVNEESTDTLLRLSELNTSVTASGMEELKRFPFIKWENESAFSFTNGSDWFEFNYGEKKLIKTFTLPDAAGNPDIAPGNKAIAYTIDNNLLINTGGEVIKVTNDENKGIVNGQAVHRNEFGISKGTFWSPAGKLLAFYRMDETMVTEYPLVDVTERIATLQNIRYPMAGMTSHEVTVGIFNPFSKTTVFIETGKPADQYLTNIAWSPDEKSIFIAVLNRDQNHMKLNEYDVAGGKFIRTLFEEKNDRYVEPLHPMVFVPGSEGKFIWQSQRDGFNHLYLYNRDGSLAKQLTSGNWLVTEMIGFDLNAKGLFYTSTAISPLQDQLYHLDLKSGKSSRLTSEEGVHAPVIREDGKYLLSRCSNPLVASRTRLISFSGKLNRIIHEDINPIKDYKTGEVSIVILKADDGTDLYARLTKPADFDPAKKYPVLIYVYGGPHAQLVTGGWLNGGGLFDQYLAQKGYVVFTLDNRGSANRGFEFESCIHRNLGVIEMADQLKGVEYLKSQPWVDASRIGLDGWSYGGFMTLTMKLNHPEIFKVATCGGPVTDWKYYEVMYGERYMDTPEQNPEGYKNACLTDKTDKLDGKLMIIHGALDNTVVWQNSLQFLMKCIEQKKQVDYFVYPTHEHNVRGIDRAHMFRKLAEYFDQNL
ncbi:MAG: S9 family peptidase [Bacteroidales bacterium]|nr:S9 family peptidase [Bacteroidales bacterium]